MSGGVRAEPNTVTAGPTLASAEKPRRELGGDVVHAPGVGGSHLRRLVPEPQQQLLVEGQLALAVGAVRRPLPWAASVCARRGL